MEQLLPYYERELGILRGYGRQFAERYPGVAGQLQMAGEVCEDPQIEHMIQGFALLSARVAKRLDDDYPQLTESLLETLYPHYLRSFPSCSIAQVDADGAADQPSGIVSLIARGTLMKSAPVQGVKCQFRTAYPTEVAPLALPHARFDAIFQAPPVIRLGPGVGAQISVVLASTALSSLTELKLPRLRVFMDGQPSFVAALRDSLFLCGAGAYVDWAGSSAWHGLERSPLSAVGFAEDDALIPFSARSHPAYRLLTEYFAFPEKFHFIDIDLASIVAVLPAGCRRCTLHLPLKGIAPDSDRARMLAGLSARNLLLHCTPVVNLFQQPGAPVNITQASADYAVLADSARPYAYEVHSIVAARLVSQNDEGSSVTPLHPFYCLRHGQHARRGGHYYLTRRDDGVANNSLGHEMRIALVEGDLTAIAGAVQTLSLELLCSNRDLPSGLTYGQPKGDLHVAGVFDNTPIRLLRKPGIALRFGTGNGAHWRLVAHLGLHHRALTSVGLEEFQTMLGLYDLSDSAITQRQIGGITALDYRMVMAWIGGQPCAALMPGIEVRMTLEPAAFVGASIHLFAQVIEHFFGLYSQVNVFSQLVVVSAHDGEELLRCAPRSGKGALV